MFPQSLQRFFLCFLFPRYKHSNVKFRQAKTKFLNQSQPREVTTSKFRLKEAHPWSWVPQSTGLLKIRSESGKAARTNHNTLYNSTHVSLAKFYIHSCMKWTNHSSCYFHSVPNIITLIDNLQYFSGRNYIQSSIKNQNIR